jgi:hypothetical protein
MNTTPVRAEVYEPDEALPPDLRMLRRFAQLMDNAFAIPGTNRGVGLGPIIGLIPGVGDAIVALFSTWMVVGAMRHRVPTMKLFRMCFNIAVDLVIGAIPVAGDAFDFLFTENMRNLEILLRYRDRSRPPRSYASIAILIGALFAGFFILSLAVVLWIIIGLVRFARSL